MTRFFILIPFVCFLSCGESKDANGNKSGETTQNITDEKLEFDLYIEFISATYHSDDYKGVKMILDDNKVWFKLDGIVLDSGVYKLENNKLTLHMVSQEFDKVYSWSEGPDNELELVQMGTDQHIKALILSRKEQ